MSQPQELFNSIVEKLSRVPDVHLGKMMSSPGLKYKDKVFAFYHRESMRFRLGPNFDPVKKPPLKGWFIVEKYESDTWDKLAEIALEFTKTLK